MYLSGLVPTGLDHIPAQNKAGADLASTLAAYNQVKAAGQLTNGYITTIQQAFLKIGQDFWAYTRQSNMQSPDRAKRGGDEILALAKQLAGDRELDRAALQSPATPAPAPVPTPGAAAPLPPVIQVPLPPPALPQEGFPPLVLLPGPGPQQPSQPFQPAGPSTISRPGPTVITGGGGTPYDPGMQPPAASANPAFPEWLPWVAAAAIGLLFLSGSNRRGR